MMHASVDVLWACVIAETFLTSSSVASVNARSDAHERSVAIVALAGATFAGVQGAGGRTTVIENAVNRILATGNPAYELVAHVCGVDMPELLIESQVASVIDVSSLQVPAGCPCVP